MLLAKALLATAVFTGMALAVSAVHAQPALENARTEERAEFLQICQSLRNSYEPYYGRLALRDLEGALAESASRDPEQTLRLRVAIGEKLIQAGRPQEAISVLETAASPTRSLVLLPPARDQPLRAKQLLLQLTAHFQAGEDENCVARHTATSCILPFSEEAQHDLPEHARLAGDIALELSELYPGQPLAPWLLNISRMVSNDYPAGVPEALRLPTDAFESEEPFAAWIDRGHELGIGAVDLAGGAIMDDFDGDGLLDIITSTADPCDHLKAYRNDGAGGFEDVSRAWGLDIQLGGLNVIQGDYDGDGALDLLVLRGGWLGGYGRIRNSLLHNELAGPAAGFVDETRAAGLANPAHPTQTAAWADYDGDGDLDLYVGNEAPGSEPGRSQLFRNEGSDGDRVGGAGKSTVTFVDVALEAGVRNDVFAKGVAWGDYDNDGDPDLYVSNVGPNRLYRNDGVGADGVVVFRDVAAELGVDRPSGRSFATWFFDYDNDGWLDLFVADYNQPPEAMMASYFGQPTSSGQPLIYHNEGGTFREVSRSLGLTRPVLPMGANYGDLDNDGWLDFYLGTGEPSVWALVPNLMFRNVGGQRFADVTFAGGFGHLQKGHGVAFGDIDNDGDQDLLHQLGGFYSGDDFGNALFENPGNDASWITLRLVGVRSNRFGVGARIEVRLGNGTEERSVHLVGGSGGSFGGSSLQQEIGLGEASIVREIIVRWPGSGTVQRFQNVLPNKVYRVVEGHSKLEEIPTTPVRLGEGSATEPDEHSH